MPFNKDCSLATKASAEAKNTPVHGLWLIVNSIPNINDLIKFSLPTLNLYETVDQKVGNFLNAYMDMQWSPIIGSQVPKMLK